MLCNIYIKESTLELRNMGIKSSTPIFFINVSQPSMIKLKEMEVPNKLEIYMVQDDPYLKDLSSKWLNGGVQLPEIRIVEKIIQSPPRIIEKTIEIPVEVIREVIKEVEVVRAPKVIVESAPAKPEVPSAQSQANEDEGILIDTKIAFQDWKSKNIKPSKVEAVKEVAEDILVLPTEIIDPMVEDTTMPILIEVNSNDAIVEHEEVVTKGPITIVNKPGVKKTRKKEEEPLEFTVQLTPEDLEKYKDEIEEK